MKIKFKWIGAACFTMQVDGKLKVACDPCLSHKGTKYDFKFFKSKRVIEPEYEPSDLYDVDVWLLTHRHEDHIDPLGLDYLKDNSKKFVQKGLTKMLAEEGVRNYDTMVWGEARKFSKDDLKVNIKAVPAIHGSNALSSFFAGEVNGYWLTIDSPEESKTIYLTSDTICDKKIEQSLGNTLCDVLIPNMGAVMNGSFGGPLTLDTEMLDHMMDCLEPKAVLPIHYGCFSHYSSEFPKVNYNHVSQLKKLERGKILELTI